MAREMKDSGVQWIGEIPEDWALISFGYIADVFGRIGFRGYTVEDLVDQGDGPITLSPSNIVDQKLSLNKCSYISWDKYYESPEIQINFGDIILVKTASVGKCAIYSSKELATLNPQLVVLKNLKCNNKYLYYALISDVGQIPILLDNFGSVIPTITQNSLCHYKIPLPSISEQNIIASFLDSKCAEIDKAIDATKASIEEYKKLRQAIITEAVTKGLDPNVEMKDSGIEWIGEIPATWNTVILSKLGKQIKNSNKGLIENNLLSLSYGRIIRKNIDTTFGLLPESFETYNIIEQNDIVLRLTDLQNDHKSLRVGLSSERGIITSAYLSIKLNDTITPKYIYYQLHSFDVCKGFYGMGAGVRQGLNWEEVKKLQIVVPSEEEQQKIVMYLDSKCSEIDALIKSKEKLVEDLTAYRKSLIYEYVTGKKEV